jgi:hypothetical protein
LMSIWVRELFMDRLERQKALLLFLLVN